MTHRPNGPLRKKFASNSPLAFFKSQIVRDLEVLCLFQNSLTGPGYANYDSSIQKDTKLSEKVTLQLRADAFNTLNRTNFAVPSNRQINGGSTPFGESTAIQGNARELQLGGKIIF